MRLNLATGGLNYWFANGLLTDAGSTDFIRASKLAAALLVQAGMKQIPKKMLWEYLDIVGNRSEQVIVGRDFKQIGIPLKGTKPKEYYDLSKYKAVDYGRSRGR